MNEKFLNALARAEWAALGELENERWCVIIRYGYYFHCKYSFALSKDYHIVCITTNL